MPWERPIIRVPRCSSAFCARAARSSSTAGEDLVGRFAQQDGQRGVEHVGGGHAQVQPARRLPGQLFDVGQKGDHVVPGAGLDLRDPRGIQLAGRLGPHRLGACRPAPSRPPPWPGRRRARRAARSRSGGSPTTRRPGRDGCTCRSRSVPSIEIAVHRSKRSRRRPRRPVRSSRAARRRAPPARRARPKTTNTTARTTAPSTGCAGRPSSDRRGRKNTCRTPAAMRMIPPSTKTPRFTGSALAGQRLGRAP